MSKSFYVQKLDKFYRIQNARETKIMTLLYFNKFLVEDFLAVFFNNFMLTLKIKPRQQQQYIYILVLVGLILTYPKVERLFFQSVNIPLYFEYLEVIKYCMTA